MDFVERQREREAKQRQLSIFVASAWLGKGGCPLGPIATRQYRRPVQPKPIEKLRRTFKGKDPKPNPKYIINGVQY